MATFYPDDLWLQASNLTLGTNGVDDGAATNTSYPAFKQDVEFPVGPASIVSNTQPALTYDGTRTNVPLRQLATATTHKVLVPFPEFLLRTYVPSAGVQDGARHAATSKGILIKTLKVFYRVTTADITSITGEIDYKAFATESSLGAATAPTVVVSGGTLTAATNIYTLLLTVSTPFIITTTGSMPWAMVTVVVAGGGSVCDIFGASWAVGLGIY